MKSIYTAILLFLINLPILTFAQQRWEIYVGNPNLNYTPFNAIETYDNGFLVNTMINNNATSLIKTDCNGLQLWEKTILSENAWININQITQNNEGEIVLFGVHDYHAFVMMLDACGNAIWCNSLVNEVKYQETSYLDAIFLENGNILALVSLLDNNYKYDIGLISFDRYGNLLWFIPYHLREKYPLLELPYPISFDTIQNFIMISGYCYYAYPENPIGYYLKPMFIKIDSLFNEEWFLPYGMNDSIYGDNWGALELNGNSLRGYGYEYFVNSDTISSLLMDLDIYGNEEGVIKINNKDLGTAISSNLLRKVIQRDDTSYIAGANFGKLLNNWQPSGEWIMDTSGKIYQHQNHPNTLPALSDPMIKTSTGKYLFLAAYEGETYKNYLYKLNPDLSQAEYDTTTYLYDSLCDHQIVSDTIYLDACGIITDLRDIPSPTEYFSKISTIPVHIFPNPATSGITFEFENTEYHNDIVLRCYDINGRIVYEQALPPGQTQIKTSVSNWQSGIYVATASSREGGTGKEKFVVR